MDIFDALQNKEYAAIRFPDDYPERFSTNTTIDILIEKSLYTSIFNLVNTHSLVSKVFQSKKSSMDTLQLIMIDGSVLFFNLIWELKKESIVYLDAKNTLKETSLNNFGIKVYH